MENQVIKGIDGIPVFSWNPEKKEFYILDNKIENISSIEDFMNNITKLYKEKQLLNELEKDINNQLTMTRKLDTYNRGFFDATLHFYNRLQELKGGNTNG